jgi:Ca2+-binding EF-hand superfamily protein
LTFFRLQGTYLLFVSKSNDFHPSFMQYSQGIDFGTGIPGVDEQDLRRAFRDLDLDNDGLISYRDLRTFLEASGERPTDEEVNEMIQLADTGRDGAVHFNEFMDLFKSLTPEGAPNEVFEQAVRIMSTTQDARDTSISNEELLKLLIGRLPGSIQGKPFISREYLKEVIFRWKTNRLPALSLKDFTNVLKVPDNGISERGFKVITSQTNTVDITTLILILGAFVGAPVDERIDFACRLLDEATAGFLNEQDVMKILSCNFIGVKADLKTRRERIMKNCDMNGLVSRKQLTALAKGDPALFFPPSRIDVPIK